MTEPETKWKTIAVLLLFAACSITSADDTKSNTIYDVARNGILMQSQWINKPNDPNSSWSGHGAYTPSTNVRIASNRLDRIGGDGIILWCAKAAIVERNFVRQSNNNSLKQGHAAIRPYFCEDVVFQYNEVCETKTKFDGMIFDFDNSNQCCIYQYNISQNDGCLAGSRVFLVHGHGNLGYQVCSNTTYARNGNPAMFEQGADSSGSSIVFKNNIFIKAGTGTCRAPTGCQFERDLYFGSGYVADDAKKILGDPCLLAPGSGRRRLDSVAGYKLVKGIPYAAPPVDNLRWRKPQSPARWAGIPGREESECSPEAKSRYRVDPGPDYLRSGGGQ